MRGLLGLLLLVGCDGAWDLKHVPELDLPDGLVAYFPMEELVAGTLADIAGASDGSCMPDQCPMRTDGRVAGAMVFDGTDDVIDAPSSAGLEPIASFTVGVWVRIDREPATATTFACAVSKLYGSVTSNDNSWELCVYMGSWRYYSHNGTTEIPGPDVELGRWHHFAATWDAITKTSTLYVDGLSYGMPVVQDIRFDAGRLVIAADFDTGVTKDFFAGALDELQLYDRVLGATELRALVTLR